MLDGGVHADGSVYNCRHDACLRRVDPQPPTAADAIDADGPADERPADDGHAFSVEDFVARVPHAHGALHKHWKLVADQLTSYQREACTSICEGADAYVRVRTGGGPSEGRVGGPGGSQGRGRGPAASRISLS